MVQDSAELPLAAESDAGSSVDAASRAAGRGLAVVAGGLAAAAALARAATAYENGSDLNHVSGAWLGLALDLAHGVLYRPLEGPAGYGGTRFLPVFFVIHAGLIRLLGHPVATGFALGALCTTAMVAALFAFLRRLGVGRAEAGAFAMLALAGAGAQMGFASVRGDVLAVAFSLWGLVAALEAPRSRRALGAAATLFALALATKITAVAGLAAAVVWLVRRDARRTALVLVTSFALLVLFGLGAVQLASDGRFLRVLAASASGGAHLTGIVAAPRTFALKLWHGDAVGFSLGSLAALALVRGRRFRTLPSLFWVASLAVTIVIFGSPGTATNHLVDLEVASVAVLGCAWASGELRLARMLPTACLACAAAAAALSLSAVARDRAEPSRHDAIAEALRMAGGAGGILSEDPLVPVAGAGEIYLLDAFMFRVACEREPSFGEPLLERVRSGRFTAIVLLADPAHDPLGWYRTEHFGPGFARAVLDRYVLKGRAGRYFVFIPRAGAATATKRRVANR